MDIGLTISRTFSIVGQRFGPLLGLWGVYFGIQIGLMLLLGLVLGGTAMAGLAMGSPETMGSAAAMGGGMILGVFVFYLLYFLTYFAQMASMIAMASPLQRLNFGDAFNVGLRSAPTLLGVFVLFAIAYVVLVIVFGILGAALSMAGTAGVALLVVLIVPAVIYLLCRISIVNSVVAVERIGNPITAISRSWRLTGGKVLAIFAVLLIFGIAAAIVMGLLFVPVFASFSSAMQGGTPPFGSLAFLGIGFLVVGLAITVFMSALLAVIHEQVSGDSGESMTTVFS